MDCSHGKRLWELSKHKYDPLWLKGGGHCNLELYPEYIKHLKKFVSFVAKRKAARSSKPTETDDGEQNKLIGSQPPTEAPEPLTRPESSRISLDGRIGNPNKVDQPEKSRLSSDFTEKRTRGPVW